jgi:UDP-N-acetylmuramoylalanine--D-glutamate ligase
LIKAQTYKGKTIGVFGLARTGVAAVEALMASGADVRAWDDNPDRNAAVSFDTCNLHNVDFEELDALLLAPGVPFTHPEPHGLVKKAKQTGVEIISDFDVFEGGRHDLPQHQTVAITGTNGKSTTTALIAHMVNECGQSVVMGGNIGTGVLALDPLPAGGVYVFEMSSFQLDITSKFKPDISVFLNISPDHLDRHGDMVAYAYAKGRIFDIQDETGKAVISVDDQISEDFAVQYAKRTLPFSVKSHLDYGVYAQNSMLYDCLGECEVIYDLGGAKALVGEHNHQNAVAAYAVGKLLGFDGAAIIEAFNSFPGLEHRQEIVANIAGVMFVNDSKGTNPDAAARALDAFDNIHWIAGGRAKGEMGTTLTCHIAGVKRAYLIGESAQEIADLLGEKIPYSIFNSLKSAVDAAKYEAVAGDVVLLSPACTAFDQFDSFVERGNVFRSIVKEYGELSQ